MLEILLEMSNVMLSEDPVAGHIPLYTVLDWSATYKLNNYAIKLVAKNLTNKSYFTRRTDEYPGPGIIPAVGRSFYLGFPAKF
jgi:Fe(3+) dicitrate transport protein